MESNVRYITYGANEKEIIKTGIEAIREVLMGDDNEKKKSLLFALDWFMDPYYKQDHYIADIRDELTDLLQIVVISSSDDVSEDALDLLSSYAWGPFEILEKRIDKVPERIKPYVLEVINMDKE
ncbi:MAG: hypothetical protein HFH74_09345 [Lachnospiraceae bacterium]|jgi:hypothetical protein|nr:hypothetical protein [Lachnospiraceae bacterium]